MAEVQSNTEQAIKILITDRIAQEVNLVQVERIHSLKTSTKGNRIAVRI